MSFPTRALSAWMLAFGLTSALTDRTAASPLEAGFDGRVVRLFLPGTFSEYAIERALPGERFDLLEYAPTGCTAACTYYDYAIEEGARYDYRIHVVFPTGEALTFGPVRVEVAFPEGRPFGSRMAPNPIGASAGSLGGAIVFTVPATLAGQGMIEVRATLFDATGRTIRRFEPRPLGVGEHRMEWDLLDDAGRPVRSGSYFYRLTSIAGTSESDGRPGRASRSVTESGRFLVVR